MEPPLKLDLSFDEAMSRFVATEPKEVVESIERSKTKEPPQDAPLRGQNILSGKHQKRI
ncbi:MAG: hypothetical protein ACT4O2_02845 [Beijerinckiaceae bacterium]